MSDSHQLQSGSMDTFALLEQLRPVIAGAPVATLACMFGSRAESNVGPLSDYDIAVLLDRDADHEPACLQLTRQIRRELQAEAIDLVLLNEAPVELAFNVIANGRLIYQRDPGTRVEYEATVMSRYYDLLPMLRAQRQNILRGDDYDRRVQRYRAAPGRTERTLEHGNRSRSIPPATLSNCNTRIRCSAQRVTATSTTHSARAFMLSSNKWPRAHRQKRSTVPARMA